MHRVRTESCLKFLKSVFRTVPRSILNLKSANRTVKKAFMFPFIVNSAKGNVSKIKAFYFFFNERESHLF